MTCDEIASYSGEQREDFFSNKGSYQSLYFRLILQPTPPPFEASILIFSFIIIYT